MSPIDDIIRGKQELGSLCAPRISSSRSAVACYVVPTNEELMPSRAGAGSQGGGADVQRQSAAVMRAMKET